MDEGLVQQETLPAARWTNIDLRELRQGGIERDNSVVKEAIGAILSGDDVEVTDAVVLLGANVDTRDSQVAKMVLGALLIKPDRELSDAKRVALSMLSQLPSEDQAINLLTGNIATYDDDPMVRLAGANLLAQGEHEVGYEQLLRLAKYSFEEVDIRYEALALANTLAPGSDAVRTATTDLLRDIPAGNPRLMDQTLRILDTPETPAALVVGSNELRGVVGFAPAILIDSATPVSALDELGAAYEGKYGILTDTLALGLHMRDPDSLAKVYLEERAERIKQLGLGGELLEFLG